MLQTEWLDMSHGYSNWNEKIWYWRSFHKTAFLVRQTHEINLYSHETSKLAIHASNWMIRYVIWHSSNWNEKIRYWRSFHKTAFLVRQTHEINFYSHESWKLAIHASNWMIRYVTWLVQTETKKSDIKLDLCHQCCGSGSGIRDPVPFWPLDPGSGIRDG
jgi:D-ribose pyranose/furanose isomerase RbsD